MKINNDALLDIENGFSSLKDSSSDLRSAGKIGDAIKSLLGANVTVEVTHPKKMSDACDVMSIYPDPKTVDLLVDAIIKQKPDAEIVNIWKNSGAWVIEIDDRILSDKCGLSEKELTALILHEVGHAVEDSAIPMRMCKILKMQMATADRVSKAVTQNSLFAKAISIPILNAGAFNRHEESLKREIRADKYSIACGYGTYLNSAIDKIIGYVGSSDITPDEEMVTLMGFSVDTVNNLMKRQDHIVRKNYMTMIAHTPSRITREALDALTQRFIGESFLHENAHTQSQKHYNYIHDTLDHIVEEASSYNEFTIPGKIHRMKKIDPMEIDYIGLEVNNIKTNDDKIMVVSYIYSKLDVIDYYIALIDSKNPNYVIPHTRDSLVKMRETLNNYRLAAINKKLPEVKYGISIQYPTGYEG